MSCSIKRVCLSNACTYRKECECACEGWFTDPIYLQRCQAACYNDANIRHRGLQDFVNKYLCGTDLSAQEIYNKTGYTCAGLDPLQDTEQGRNYQRQQDQDQRNQAQEEAARKRTLTILIILAALIIVFVGVVRTT